MLFEVAFVVVMLAVMWLAIGTVDTVVAMARHEWRFNLRTMLRAFAIISLAMGALTMLIRR
jgi:hypothetical protein